jgi:hypothetical protein
LPPLLNSILHPLDLTQQEDWVINRELTISGNNLRILQEYESARTFRAQTSKRFTAFQVDNNALVD